MNQSNLDLFKSFFQSERSAGFLLITCTVISLIVANSGWREEYAHFWHGHIDLSFSSVQLNYSIEQWINDGLMAIFFLLVGLEIERELYVGELSDFKNAVLPILAAVGGMLFPALIHFLFNRGTPAQAGFGIPMATDIAFALGILSLVGKKVPVSLKIFLTALAIIDDLGAIVIIAVFYTKSISTYYVIAAIGIFLILFILSKLKVYWLLLYIIGGIIMWYCMLKSGVHATIAGVLLAFAIPFHSDDAKNPSYKLQSWLHYPVALVIIPIFALANTVIIFPKDIVSVLSSKNSLGIILGLFIGKFAGIFLLSFIAVKTGIAKLAVGIRWQNLMGVSLLGGIGFTMSIFITDLAFKDPVMIAASKISVLMASTIAAIVGYLALISSKEVTTQ